MGQDELYMKVQQLLKENKELREENQRLRAHLGIKKGEDSSELETDLLPMYRDHDPIESSDRAVHMRSSPQEKVQLFLSLFRGREDVYAKRYQNKKGESGYTVVCLNEWEQGICTKPKVKCTECQHRNFPPYNEEAIERHLRGKEILGIYPMLCDETCYFLAMDFDKGEWEKDIATIRKVCHKHQIPCYVERSRSGLGAHIWFFFLERISAAIARKFGSSLISHAMMVRHELEFTSYDRLFPNQDTLPGGGLGNLIALPLQKDPRRDHNTVFIDEDFNPYPDQWSLLNSVKKITEDEINSYISLLSVTETLDIWPKKDREKPWLSKTEKFKLNKKDFPENVNITRANMLYIDKALFSEKSLSVIKRMAGFVNPQFYKMQAMRKSTFKTPRLIDLSHETKEYLGLPRGCENGLCQLFQTYGVHMNWSDETNQGRPIPIEFHGELFEEQEDAAQSLLLHHNGILAATTAFGKTVIATYLIGERKVNTLILVHTRSLLKQWMDQLNKFLVVHEKDPVESERSSLEIGQIGGGKYQPNGVVDVAIMQSLVNKDEVKDIVRDYGMVIVDECHHVSAFSFEQILKTVMARYVYGLTATPYRQDGHHPIMFMQCGPVRYLVDPREQASKRPFERYVVPRFTSFRQPMGGDKELPIGSLYTVLGESMTRNQFIVNDIIQCVSEGRNPLILTQRTAHVKRLAQSLEDRVPNVITLTGRKSKKEREAHYGTLRELKENENFVIVATGKYVGEGFDEPRLDTLFLVMPISWKGVVQQYAGRLHRLHDSKKDVLIYDYIDVHVGVFDKMYQKRLKGYASMGYRVMDVNASTEVTDTLFTNKTFFPVFCSDITGAREEVLVVSPSVSRKWLMRVLDVLKEGIDKGIVVTIITRPVSDYPSKDRVRVEEMIDLLEKTHVNLLLKSNLYQKFAIVDKRIVWYGSMDLLSYGRREETMIRLDSTEIAYELLESMELIER